MNRSDIDQKFLDEITNNLYPTIEQERPPLRIDIEGVGDQPAPEEVAPVPAAAQAPVAPLAPADGAPSMTAYDPTVRERLAEFLQAGLESFGMERFQARRQAQSLIGGPSSNLPLQLGVADIVPFLGTGLQTEEAGRMLGDAADLAQQGDLGGAALNAAIGAVGLIPGAVGTVQAARKIGDIANIAGDKAVQAITGNPQATAMGVLEEAGQMSPLARIVPGVQPQAAPQRSNIGFYSAVEKAVLDSKQEKGTGAQFLAQITKTQGVKPEELKWTGLDEFLKGKKSVTKAEIQDYLNANRVDVREVRLGDYSKYGLEDMWEAASNRTKFSQYTLPGGENYREILLTLPIQAKGTSRYEVRPRKTPGESAVFDTETNKVIMFGRDAGMYQEADRLNRELAGTQLFRSTHFDQPNILAHMRVNDRVVDGKKTLFIEEIQSDWHQAGRKKGYAGADTKNAEAAFKQYSQELADKYNLNPEQNLSMYATMKGMQPEEVAKYDELQSAWVSSKGGVPDAPFKTSWHELTLKRAIQEASEKGYDQIAITTGKTQAERYDLSKQIDEINVVGRTNAVTGERSKSVALDTVGGQSIRLGVAPDGTVDNVNDQDMNNLIGKSLDEVVGKELAKKIMEGGSQTISGEGLKVGGEGMEGFYDNILPKSLEKLGKKFDAKVGKTEMDGVEVWQMDITPKMRETVTKQGQPLFQIGVGGGAAAGAATMQDNEERM